MNLEILHALNAERAARRAAVLVTDVVGGKQRLVKAAEIANDPLKAVLEKRLRMAKSGMEETAQGRFFLTVYVPSPRLVITTDRFVQRPGPAKNSSSTSCASVIMYPGFLVESS